MNNYHFPHRKGLTLLVAIISFLSLPTLAAINQTKSNQTEIYQTTFFAQYAPRNALEMVQQLPGFTFDEGSSERGFGGNAGNVLIDGVRPTTKSGGIAAALTRIPASQVAQVALQRGNSVEAGGHALIANVISIKSHTSGSWTMRARQTKNTNVKPNVEAVLRSPIGGWATAFDLDIGTSPFYRPAIVEQYNSQSELLAVADETWSYSNRIDHFNGEGSRLLAGGKLTLNGRLAWDKYQGDLRQQRFSNPLTTTGEVSSFWHLDEQNQAKLGELGIDWAKTTGDWTLRLLSLAVRNDSQYQYDYHQHYLQQKGEQNVNSHYQQDRLKSEVVARATYSNVGHGLVKPEFGIEVANNRLDTRAMNGQVGSLEAVFGSDLIVKEHRSEAFANVVYQANSALVIEGGLTYETSQIEVNGDASHRQTFNYIKPRFTASYQLDDKTRLTFEAERRVGQLSFNHFAANSVAFEQRTNAGNPQLSPDQTDELATTFDWHFSERGSLKVKAFHQWRSDILEQVIVATDDQGNINQGLGNAGDATLWGIRTQLKLPIDDFIPHGLIDFSYRITHSDFDDPLINGKRGSRDISNTTPEWFQFQFRQDLTARQFSWGVEYWGGFSYDDFLVDEIQTFNANKTLHFFVETTRFFGVKIQLEVTNANTSRRRFTRRYYQHTRAGEYLGSEVAKRKSHPYYLLSVFGEF